MKRYIRFSAWLLTLLLIVPLLSGCQPAQSAVRTETAQPELTGEPELALLTPAPEAQAPVTEAPTAEPTPTPEPTATPLPITEDGVYTSKEDVALYLHIFGHLPGNFITKKQAQKLGWPGGSLEAYAPGKCIGGDWFGNYEGLLPSAKGREYHECDIDTLGAKKRGVKRIIYSNDGLIYYTEDHYETFTLLYGDE
jgi:hypothetical protein